LPELAARFAHSSGAPSSVEVIAGHVNWTPWRLNVAVTDSASASRSAGAPPLLKGAGPLKSYPTSNLKLLPPPGDKYRFDLAIGFSGSTVLADLFQSGRVASPAQYLTPDGILAAEISGAPPGANVVADAQYGFINDLLALYAPTYQVPINVQNMNQSLIAKNVRVSGGDNTMTATGQVSMGAISYNATVRTAGSDLTIRQVTLDAPGANCDATDLMERLRCQAEQAAMAGSSQAIANGLTNYYQGQAFHYSTADHPLTFVLGDVEFEAVFEALKSSSRDSMISEAGRVRIKRRGRRAGEAES
jgi:hypothetical protein